MVKVIIGLIIGVWLSAMAPTQAEWIRTVTIDAYNWVINDGPAFVEHVQEFEGNTDEDSGTGNN